MGGWDCSGQTDYDGDRTMKAMGDARCLDVSSSSKKSEWVGVDMNMMRFCCRRRVIVMIVWI